MEKLIDKLLPCPFCGGTDRQFKNVLTTGRQLVKIYCKCGRSVIAPTVYKAVELWNTREQFELSSVGEYADEPALNPA